MGPRLWIAWCRIALGFLFFLLVIQPEDASSRRHLPCCFVITSSPVSSLDPHRFTSLSDLQIANLTYDTLVALNSPEIAPKLAARWSVSPDGLTYTFILRKAVSFHDGMLLQADSVKASFERARILPATRDLFAIIREIQIRDPSTIVIKLRQPSSSFLGTLTMPWAAIISSKALNEGLNLSVVSAGSGPFRVRQFSTDRLMLSRNDAYWGRRSQLQGISILFGIDSQTRVLTLMSRRADVALGLPPDAEKMVGVSSRVELRTTPKAESVWVEFDLAGKQFSQIRLRQAVSHAISRENIVSIFGKEIVKPAEVGIIPPELFPEASASVPQFDPPLARKYLAEVTALQPLRLLRPRPSPYEQAVVAVAQQLRAIGLEIRLVDVESQEYERAISNRRGDLWLRTLMFLPDLDAAFRSAFFKGSPRNYAGYFNPTFERLISEGMATQNPQLKAMLFKQSQEQIVQRDIVAIPLFYTTWVYATRSDVRGLQISPYGLLDLTGVKIE